MNDDSDDSKQEKIREKVGILDRPIGFASVTGRDMSYGLVALFAVSLFVALQMLVVWFAASSVGVSRSSEAIPPVSVALIGHTAYASTGVRDILNINIAAVMTANAVWLFSWSVAMYFAWTPHTRLPFRAPRRPPKGVIWLFAITGFTALIRSARSVVPSLREISFLSANIMVLLLIAAAFLYTFGYVSQEIDIGEPE